MMKPVTTNPVRDASIVALSLFSWCLGDLSAQANPTGGKVTQGGATFSTSGSQFTINQTSASAVINWQTFNIGAGETTTFVQPTASSVAWNTIDAGNPVQILGNLNANGYVVLQSPSGFYIGGQGNISTHGLLMTTASGPVPDITSGGAWQFNTPPPTAQIINFGQINVTGGGSAFLIANDIENNGTISAPQGRIGLYAGEQVLVSTSPDGRGLSAHVTLPQGSVDNEGNLIADGGLIAAQAKVVNQNGLIQANAVQSINGIVELVAGDSLAVGAKSDIEVNGDATAANTQASPGGFVVLQSGNTYADTSASTINVSGHLGGQNGIVEILGDGLVNSRIGSTFAYLNNPFDITLGNNSTDTSSSSPNFNISDLSYSQMDFHALDSIEMGNGANFNFNDLNTLGIGTFILSAGNNITMDDGSGISTGQNLEVDLTAGTGLAPGTQPVSGIRNGGIYLDGDAFIFTQNGNINLWAASDVLVNGGDFGGVTTFGGGNISVNAQYGNVNSGDNTHGFDFGLASAPYYDVDFLLGGISTGAGGNVTINAGGNITSFLPTQTGNPQDFLNAQGDAGSGAFGPEAGNVTLNAGGNVYGHYVVANGAGKITAGGDIGGSLSDLANNPGDGFALSLIKGSWNVAAPNGNIYVQDVRNPSGILGTSASASASYPGYHLFDYDPQASLSLDAGDSVEFTGYEAPHTPVGYIGTSELIPFLLPPVLNVVAGSGGFILDTSVSLFPSAFQGLTITTLNGGNFGVPNSVDPFSATPVVFNMSNSTDRQWVGPGSFGFGSGVPTTSSELNDPNPVDISISGSMNAVSLYVTEAAQVTIGGDMINSSFVGENLHVTDQTSVNVAGQIFYSPLYAFAPLGVSITSANPANPAAWDSVFSLALTPSMLASLATLNVNTLGTTALNFYLKENNYLLFPDSTTATTTYGINPGFVYDLASLQLGFKGNLSAQLSASQIAALEGGTFTVLVADGQGNPVVDVNGHLETRTYTFSAAPAIATLNTESVNSTLTIAPGLQIGGPGQFSVQAQSIDLGNSAGIGSAGFGKSGINFNQFDYSSLKSLLPDPAAGGSSVTVNVADDLTMATSGIFSIDGGDVSVTAGGEIDLSRGSFVFPIDTCYGIFTSGHSDVDVIAGGDINIGSSRIATFDGGDVTVESLNGDVNAGNGANIALVVYGFSPNPADGSPEFGEFGTVSDLKTLRANPPPFGSGILAQLPLKQYQSPGENGQPGNITVLAPRGDITSNLGGISQFALDQITAPGPVVTLTAGVPGTTYIKNQDGLNGVDINGVFHPEGNIILGNGGVVGGTVNISAQGVVQGLIVSRQNSNIQTPQAFEGTVLSGGAANFTGGGSVGGVVVGVGGISVSGGGAVTATLLSQNVSVGGAASQSTLGTTASATSASQSAATQSSSDAKEQLASDDNGSDDDKKKKKRQTLMQKVKRVTVILPKT